MLKVRLFGRDVNGADFTHCGIAEKYHKAFPGRGSFQRSSFWLKAIRSPHADRLWWRDRIIKLEHTMKKLIWALAGLMIAFGPAQISPEALAAKKTASTKYNFSAVQPAKKVKKKKTAKAKKPTRQTRTASRSSGFFNGLFSSSNKRTRRGHYRGKKVVSYKTSEKPGTIVISTSKRKLFYVMPNGKAMQYGVGVGRTGFTWRGTHRITRKGEWPAWHPPQEMIAREKKLYGRTLPTRMEGGPNNPLGARALYIGNTLYRIHGTNAPSTIGSAVSSGCIRLVNEEVIDLYKRVRVGAKVVVN
jgi:lipoprotein-anchoring transpeptidase ErfK/SrfK